MFDPKKISTNVLKDIQETVEPGVKVETLTVVEAFDAWLKYQGIIGYTTRIVNVLRQLQESEIH